MQGTSHSRAAVQAKIRPGRAQRLRREDARVKKFKTHLQRQLGADVYTGGGVFTQTDSRSTGSGAESARSHTRPCSATQPAPRASTLKLASRGCLQRTLWLWGATSPLPPSAQNLTLCDRRRR